VNDRAAATRLLQALRVVGQALDARDYPWGKPLSTDLQRWLEKRT
jgi:hypothetical protein